MRHQDHQDGGLLCSQHRAVVDLLARPRTRLESMFAEKIGVGRFSSRHRGPGSRRMDHIRTTARTSQGSWGSDATSATVIGLMGNRSR
jgi:hypothetical protein